MQVKFVKIGASLVTTSIMTEWYCFLFGSWFDSILVKHRVHESTMLLVKMRNSGYFSLLCNFMLKLIFVKSDLFFFISGCSCCHMFMADLPEPDLHDECRWMFYHTPRLYLLRIRETHALQPNTGHTSYTSNSKGENGVASVSEREIRR